MSIGQAIVALTGVGYFIVGCEQLHKKSYSNSMTWFGYAFAQIGLWMNLK